MVLKRDPDAWIACDGLAVAVATQARVLGVDAHAVEGYADMASSSAPDEWERGWHVWVRVGDEGFDPKAYGRQNANDRPLYRNYEAVADFDF